ncbi:uncharacterized protein LOC142616705 [Castanea sativa]|uniref:uncharacterized protein LOC142616705 n=1 Tax=Castanea sativa TaxID=21020 RepID=UPI003F65338A
MASATNTNGSTNASTSVTQSPSTQDSPMDKPLFLHHAKNPSLVLVTQPLIGGENYAAWAGAVRKALLTKNKLGFIDWTLTLSSPLVSTPSNVQAWIRCDNMTNGPRIFNLQKDIAELHQGEMSVTDFFTQLKVFWDQLQNLSPFPSCTCVLLMDPIPSLSKVYSLLIQEETQRSVPNASIAKVDSTAIAAKLFNEHLGPNLGNSGGKGKERPTCTFYGKIDHTVDKCYKKHGFPPRFKFKNRPPMAHQVSSDVLPTTSPLHHQNSVFTPEQCQQLLALFGASNSSLVAASASPKESLMANVASSSASTGVTMSGIDLSHSVFSTQVVNRRAYDKQTWVLDTRATDHFVCSVDMLTSITATMQSLVHLPNGESAQVTHIGTIVLSSSLTLYNVLCVPSFSFNLLSVSTLTLSQPCCLVFLSTYCCIQDLLSWKMIGVGKAVDALYLLQCDTFQHISSSSLADYLINHKFHAATFPPFSAATSATTSSSSSHLWHAR